MSTVLEQQQQTQMQQTRPWWSPFSAFSAFSPFSSSSFSQTQTQDRSYVEMEDGKHYGVTLYNGHETRCYATITIDGKKMGKWLLEPYQRATIERPVEIDKKFTFFKVSSEGGQAAGLTKFDSNNGLVQVEFVPEQKNVVKAEEYLDYRLPLRSGAGNKSKHANFVSSNNHNLSLNDRGDRGDRRACCTAKSAYEEGGTGLLGKSNQQFGIADNLVLDYNQNVTITLRLVGRKAPVPAPAPEPVPIPPVSLVPAPVVYDVITPLSQIPRRNAVPPPIW